MIVELKNVHLHETQMALARQDGSIIAATDLQSISVQLKTRI